MIRLSWDRSLAASTWTKVGKCSDGWCRSFRQGRRRRSENLGASETAHMDAVMGPKVVAVTRTK